MKWYKLIKDYKDTYKKGKKFFVLSESEFIGVKEFVLQTQELEGKIIVTEKDLKNNFKRVNLIKKRNDIND
jgi:hypothetical protein